MRDIQKIVQEYIDRGWSPVRVRPQSKAPWDDGWPQATYTPSDFKPDDNIGLKFGQGLYDWDLDCPAAVIAADFILPKTGCVYGRPGKLRSHRLVACNEPITLLKVIGLDKKTILEFRGLSKTGSASQSVVPLSIHEDTGELIEWDTFQQPATIGDQHVAYRLTYHVAIAVELARAMPDKNRHVVALALAGFFYRAGLVEPEIVRIIQAVWAILHAPTDHIDNGIEAARDSISKLKANPNAAVTGGPVLKAMLADGSKVVRQINEWLGRTDDAEKEDALERMNKTYFIVEADTQIVVADESRDTIRLWNFADFRKKFIKEKVADEPLADWWLSHPQGRQFEQLVYAPPGSPFVAGPKDYNGWKNFTVEPLPSLDKWELLYDHLAHVICGGDDTLFYWTLNWCAALVQFPGLHANTALALMGGQGSGKGVFAHNALGLLFHPRHYVQILSRETVYGRFNDVLSGRCLVFLDEATWGGSRQENSTLKGLITSDRINIERKGIPVVSEPSMLHLILASNEDWPVGLDKDDRRWVIYRLNEKYRDDPDYFRPLIHELNTGGRAAFLHFLMTLSVDMVVLRQPPNTAWKDELKQRSLPPEEQWWLERLNDGRVLDSDKQWPDRARIEAVHARYISHMQALGKANRISSDSLGRLLRKMCPSLKDTRETNGDRKRVYLFPTLDIARAEAEKYLKFKFTWNNPINRDDALLSSA